jgi:hypothetical protein
MGSICTSVNKKDKKSTIVANRKDSERIENDNSIKADNTNPIKNTEDKKNEPNNTSRSKQSEMISENDDENSGNREISKPKKEQNNFSNPDIIISYLDNGKTEFNEIFKTNDNISSLFDILLEKKSKYAQYDLITNEELSLSSKLNEKIGNIFPNTENAEVKMIYIGLDLSDDMKTFYENHNTAIGIPLFNTKEGIDLLIFHKQNKNFTKEEIKNHKLSKFNNLSSICNGKSVLYLSGGDNHNKSKSIDLFASIDLLNIKSINELP